MSTRPLRLVHTSDLHLERPLYGVAEVPDHLRELFLDAAYLAAEQVFETALADGVDLVLLAGDIVDPQTAGPRAAVFLNRHFQRLAGRNIDVYWAGGRTDSPGGGVQPPAFPDNVHRFARGDIQQFVHQRDGHPVARIVGVSRGDGGKPRWRREQSDAEGVPTVGVGYGAAAARALSKLEPDYLALGGKHARQESTQATRLMHYPGSPQGRCPGEAGAHGCTVVDIEASGRVTTTFTATDVARWVDQRVEVDQHAERGDLETLLHERMDRQVASARGVDLLVSWTVAGGSGALMSQLCRGGLAAELLAGLRTRFGQASPATWSVSLQADVMAALPPQAYEQDTIMGDFLRAVRGYQADETQPLDLGRLLPEHLRTELLAAGVSVPEGQIRQHILTQVGRLGADLLGS